MTFFMGLLPQVTDMNLPATGLQKFKNHVTTERKRHFQSFGPSKSNYIQCRISLYPQILEAAVDENKFTVGYPVGEAIPPLCMTSWGQGEPFNLECPEYNGDRCLS